MTPRRSTLAVIVTLLLTGAGCRHVPCNESSKMAPLGPALTRLTSAVDASIAYEQVPPGLDEARLIAFTTRNNAAVLEPFAGYAVRVLAEYQHAIVLVCDAARKRALFEDVGCTMEVDRAAWQEQPAPACEFTIHVKQRCELPPSPTDTPR